MLGRCPSALSTQLSQMSFAFCIRIIIMYRFYTLLKQFDIFISLYVFGENEAGQRKRLTQIWNAEYPNHLRWRDQSLPRASKDLGPNRSNAERLQGCPGNDSESKQQQYRQTKTKAIECAWVYNSTVVKINGTNTSQKLKLQYQNPILFRVSANLGVSRSGKANRTLPQRPKLCASNGPQHHDLKPLHNHQLKCFSIWCNEMLLYCCKIQYGVAGVTIVPSCQT